MSGCPNWLKTIAFLPEWQQRQILRAAPGPISAGLRYTWRWQAHRGQEEPKGEWRVWLMMAGRGFGKTKAGAEWVSQQARNNPEARIALVGATIDEVAKVMVEGESGILAAAYPGEEPRWHAGKSILQFGSGAIGFAYSAERPEKLRGPQHHIAWCDELAKWPNAEKCWSNLMLGMRLGEMPRTLVTTTPQPVPILKQIRAEGAAESGGRMTDNPHLPPAFVEAMRDLYEGTRFGRQELHGELIEDFEGALWTRTMIEEARCGPIGPGPLSGMVRVVVGVDPPASESGICGIVAAGLGAEGIAYVLADASVGGSSPKRWADAVADAAALWCADRVVAEANQGGEMVEAVLRASDRNLPIKLRHAREAKGKRAEPVAALFEKGRVKLAGSFAELEDQLAGLMPAGGYEGPGRSPDRADAMVWAVAELMLGRRREPRLRGL